MPDICRAFGYARISILPVSGGVVPKAITAVGRALPFQGYGSISGVVYRNGLPLPNTRVYLYDVDTGSFARIAQTDAVGVYQFSNILTGRKYTVLAHDVGFNAAVADWVEPV